MCCRHSVACFHGELIRISSIQYTRACLARPKSCASWLETAAFRSASSRATMICSRTGPSAGFSPCSRRCWRSITTWNTGLMRLANVSVILDSDHEQGELEVGRLAALGEHHREDPVALERRPRQVHTDRHRACVGDVAPEHLVALDLVVDDAGPRGQRARRSDDRHELQAAQRLLEDLLDAR